MSLNKKDIAFVIFLAGLSAFAPFSTDIYLASMPILQHSFNTSIANIQLTLSLFFVMFAITQLVWGPLSDRIGRKPVVIIGVSIFIVGSLLCAYSQNITTLIIARVIQAIGACSGTVMSIAIVKDSFTHPIQMTKVLSGMMSVSIIAPMIAPIIGSYLLTSFNWQANFYFLALYGAILILAVIFVKESYPANERSPLPINKLLHAYHQQILCRPFFLAVLAITSNFAVMFSFISSSAFIYISIYHLPTHIFGYYFAFNAAGLIMGSVSLNYLKNKLNDRKIIQMALIIQLIAAVIMIASIKFNPTNILSVVLPSFFVTFGVGILHPELTRCALQNVVAYSGVASALVGTIRFMFAGSIGFLMGFQITGSALPLAVVMLSLNVLSIVFVVIYFKQEQAANETRY